MKKELEKKFEEYREYLKYEATKLTSYIMLYRHLNERKVDRLDEMNMAPAFFGITFEVLLTGIILWTEKLFDEKSERGLINFLRFIENNHELLDIKKLQERRGYPDDHWVLRARRKDPITFSKISADLERIKNLKAYKSVKLKRDKYYAHFDKEYFYSKRVQGCTLNPDSLLF